MFRIIVLHEAVVCSSEMAYMCMYMCVCVHVWVRVCLHVQGICDM